MCCRVCSGACTNALLLFILIIFGCVYYAWTSIVEAVSGLLNGGQLPFSSWFQVSSEHQEDVQAVFSTSASGTGTVLFFAGSLLLFLALAVHLSRKWQCCCCCCCCILGCLRGGSDGSSVDKDGRVKKGRCCKKKQYVYLYV